MRAMRVLLVVSQYHQAAGYPRYGAQIARGLAARGHRVTVLCRRAEPELADAGITFRSYRAPGFGTLMPMATEPAAVRGALVREAPAHDVVVSVGVLVAAPVVLIGLGTHLGYVRASREAASLWSVRGLFERVRPFHRVLSAWERRVVGGRHPVLVIVGAAQFADEYRDLYGYPADQVAVVPMGVDPDQFTFDPGLRARTRTGLGLDDHTTVLLTVANRARQKGLDVLADALGRLDTDRPWTALFAGDGSTGGGLTTATERLRRHGRVQLLGRVPDVRPLYCAADIVVFPSRYDPWGLVVTEALACGTPVIASARAGAAMAVTPGLNGAVLDRPEDAQALAAAITSMMAAVPMFDRDAVRASVLPFSYETGVGQLEEQLFSVAAATARAS